MAVALLFSASAANAARQPGKDGPFTVVAAGTIVNRYATLAADAAAGAASLSVNNPGGGNGLDPTTLTANDLLLIIQMQGASIDSTDTAGYGTVTNFNSAGRWEFATVTGPGVGGGPYSIPLAGYLKNGYTAAGNTQVIQVPQYSSLTVNAGASIAAPNWAGTFGGVVAVDVSGTATIDGDLDLGSRGFRGGTLSTNSNGANVTIYRTATTADAARKGESVAGLWSALPGGAFGRGAPANGGGGGNAHDSGGGGGANATNGLVWNGQGNPDTNPAYTSAWNLDPTLNAATTSSGGGRGGYSFSDADQNALTTAPGNAAWGGTFREQIGGIGGRPLPYDWALSRIFLGGGGGAGANSNANAGAGGRGGGMVLLYAGAVAGTGRILASGANGGNTTGFHEDASGGAGGGGTVVVQARTSVSLGQIRADGGAGGNQSTPANFPDEAQGPGGGGGGGFVHVCAPTISVGTLTANGGANGTTGSAALTEFPPNGATRGAPGTIRTTAGCVGLGPPALTFTEVGAAANAGVGGAKTGGVAWGDFNNDGCPDFLANTNDGVLATQIYAQNASGAACLGTFANVTQCLASGLLANVYDRAVAFGDYDNDGNLDFARSHSSGIEIYRSNGAGVTVDASCPAGSFAWSRFGSSGSPTAFIGGVNSEGIGWIDFDKDGDLDLYSDSADGMVMVTNNPTGTLTVDTTTGLPAFGSGNGDYSAVGDYDADGDVDVLARKDDGRDLWYNDGTAPVFFARNLNFGEVANNGNKGGVAFCDFDNDRDFDIFWTDVPTDVNQIWRNNGGVDGAVTWTAMGTLPTGTSDVDGVSCGDLDHDGDVDIMLNVSSGLVGDYVFRNDGGFAFTNVSPPGFATTTSPAGALADYDRDGDLDLLVNMDGGNQLWRNEANDRNYLMVRALHDLGVAERDAIGATVTLETCAGVPISPIEEVSGGSGHGSQDSALVHFGLRRSSAPFGPNATYVVRVKFVGGGVVQRAVTPASLACYQQVTIRNTDADDLTACSATAVTLASFTATASDSAVDLEWRTASELSNLGFHLHRSTSASGPFERVTLSLIPGLGSSPSGARYTYRDTDLANGTTYFYLLEDFETTGATNRHGPVTATPHEGSPAPTPASADAPTASAITYGTPEGGSLRVVSRSRSRLVLELTTEGFHALPREDGAVEVRIPGFSSDGGLPVKGHWLEAIAGRGVEILSVRPSRVERLALRPAANAVEVAASWDGTQTLRRSAAPGPVKPSTFARVAQVVFQSDVKKALLEMAPLRWDEAASELVFARTLTVVVGFRGREPAEAELPGSRGRRPSSAVPARRGVAFRLTAAERGLYAVRYEDLFGSRSRRAVNVRVSRLGSPVAFHIEPESIRFAPGSTLYFVSEGAAANPYGNEAVYEIELGTAGERMEVGAVSLREPSVGTYRQILALEEQRYYQAGLVEREDPWLWDMLLAPASKSFPFLVSDLASSTEAMLEVHLHGASDFPESPDHRARVRVNSVLVAEDEWDGKTSRALEIDLPSGVLREGENALEIENVGDTGASYSMIFLDRFEVAYSRRSIARDGLIEGAWMESGTAAVESVGPGAKVLEVGGKAPRWLSDPALLEGALRFGAEAGRSYLVVDEAAVRRPGVRKASPPRWRRHSSGADYVAIGPRELLPAAAPLLDLRRAQGLRVLAVPVEEIFDEFGYGEKRPEAVRDFLSHAYHRWPGGVRYAVLLGDASYDFKNHLGTGAPNAVPGMPVRTRYLWTASDPAYASVNGEDLVPDLAIGRLPAADPAELAGMVEKILAHEREGEPVAGPLVLVTDNPDSGGDFDRDADELARSVLASTPLRRISLESLGLSETRRAIVDAFAESPSIVSYVGHGGIHLWASENLFDSSSVPRLVPDKGKPIVLTLDCLNGYFHFPYFDSLGEELLKPSDRGAVAVFAPSGLSLNEPAHELHKALLEEIGSGAHRRLGDALLSAGERFLARSSYAELLAIYHLLGDPALTLR